MSAMNLAYLNLIVVNCLHALFLFFLVDWKYERRVMVVVWAAYVLSGSAFSIFLLKYAPISVTAIFTFAGLVALHFLICIGAGSGSVSKKFFFVASYLIFFYCAIILGDWISFLFGKYAPYAEIFAKVPIYAAGIFLWGFRGKAYIEKISGGITYGWKILAAFAFLTMIGSAIWTNIRPVRKPCFRSGQRV